MVQVQPLVNTARSIRLFVIASRKDREFIDLFVKALKLKGLEVFFTYPEFALTEARRHRSLTQIAQADTVVYVRSPNAAASLTCEWEATIAANLRKRFAPVTWRMTDGSELPEGIAGLEEISFTDTGQIQQSLERLISLLYRDIDWVMEHTRLGELARQWEFQQRPDSLLLTGGELKDAGQWIEKKPAGAPAPTDIHHTYVIAGMNAHLPLRDTRAASNSYNNGAREQIRSGDLLAWRSGVSFVSWLIRHVTGGSHTHVGVAWRFRGRLFVVEAREGRGVTLRAVSQTLPFDLIPTRAVWNDEVETLALEKLGKDYSYIDAALAGLGIEFRNDGEICSEYAAGILQKCLTIKDAYPDPVTPTGLVQFLLDRGHELRSIHE